MHLSSCRLYSWMHLIWQSKMVSGSTISPVADLSQSAKCDLTSRLALRSSPRNALSSASGLSLLNWLRSLTQSSPIASVIVPASAGFASSSQRRGVTPLVLLLKRSGNISARSLTVIVRNRPEWIAATPLVLCEPTMARLAMRIFRSAPSSTRLMRLNPSLVSRKAGPDGIGKGWNLPPCSSKEQLSLTSTVSARFTKGLGSRFATLSASERPIKNSIDR